MFDWLEAEEVTLIFDEDVEYDMLALAGWFQFMEA